MNNDSNNENLKCDLKKIKKKVVKAIKEFDDCKSEITSASFNVEAIRKNVLKSELNDKYINGAKNTMILKDFVLDAINKDLKINGEVIFKKLYKAIVNDAAPSYITRGGGFYFYFVFSNMECLIYQLDNFYRVQKKYKYLKEYFEGFVFLKGKLFIKFKDNPNEKSIYSNDFYLYGVIDDEREYFKEIIVVLESLGFTENKNIDKFETKNIKKIWRYIFIISFIIFIVIAVRFIFKDFIN